MIRAHRYRSLIIEMRPSISGGAYAPQSHSFGRTHFFRHRFLLGRCDAPGAILTTPKPLGLFAYTHLLASSGILLPGKPNQIGLPGTALAVTLWSRSSLVSVSS